MPLLDDIRLGGLGDAEPVIQIQSVVKQTNEALRQLSNEDRTKIIKDDSGTPRLLTGFQQDGFENSNVGVKMSQTGVDVQAAQNDELIFSTDFNLFKIVGTGTGSCTPPASWAASEVVRDTVPHNLGYKPAFLAFVTNPAISGVGYYVPGLANVPSKISLAANEVTFETYAWVDETNIYLDLVYFNSAGSAATNYDTFTWNFKYYLLQETAE